MKNFDWKDMLRDLLASVDVEAAAKTSFRDYHARGLTYVCLARSPSLTAKLYFGEPGRLRMNGQGHIVSPHDHAYGFHTFVVAGWMRNLTFEMTGGDEWNAFRYRAPMRGGDGFKLVGRRGLVKVGDDMLDPGKSYYLTPYETHTIVLPENERAILFLLQYGDMRDETMLYQKEPDAPATGDLYRPLSVAEIRSKLALAGSALELLRAGALS